MHAPTAAAPTATADPQATCVPLPLCCPSGAWLRLPDTCRAVPCRVLPPCRARRGVLLDVSMQGTSVEPDTEDISACYGQHVTPADILTGKVSAPREATLLYNQIKTIIG